MVVVQESPTLIERRLPSLLSQKWAQFDLLLIYILYSQLHQSKYALDKKLSRAFLLEIEPQKSEIYRFHVFI
jgi:hypothetical protein